jgi:hypothetical protein
MKTKSIVAGWLPHDNKNNYKIACSRQRTGLMSKMTPLTPTNGISGSMEELFDQAAYSVVKPDGK